MFFWCLTQFNAWNVNKVSPFELGWNVIFQHCVTRPPASSLHSRSSQPSASGLGESRPAQMQSKEHWGTSSDEHLSGASALRCALLSGKHSAGLSGSSNPQIQDQCVPLGFPVCAVVWKLPQDHTRVNRGFTVCAPHLSGLCFCTLPSHRCFTYLIDFIVVFSKRTSAVSITPL